MAQGELTKTIESLIKSDGRHIERHKGMICLVGWGKIIGCMCTTHLSGIAKWQCPTSPPAQKFFNNMECEQKKMFIFNWRFICRRLCGCLNSLRRQRSRKLHLKITNWEMVTILQMLLLPVATSFIVDRTQCDWTGGSTVEVNIEKERLPDVCLRFS